MDCYLNGIPIPKQAFEADNNELSTLRYFNQEYVSLGVSYEADILGDMVTFKEGKDI